MADATLPTAGTHHPGHVPFYLRVRRALQEPGHLVSLLAVEDQLITINDGGVEQTLWTHPPAARALAAGIDQVSRFGNDLLIVQGVACSLIDPTRASLCADPPECGHGHVISVRTGKSWDIGDTLDKQRRAADPTED